jgi:hypothetical protein
VASTAESSSVASMAPPCVRRWIGRSIRAARGWTADGRGLMVRWLATDSLGAMRAGWLFAARAWPREDLVLGEADSDAAYGGSTAQDERGSAATRTRVTAGELKDDDGLALVRRDEIFYELGLGVRRCPSARGALESREIMFTGFFGILSVIFLL